MKAILKIGGVLLIVLGACSPHHRQGMAPAEKTFTVFAEGFTAESEYGEPQITGRALTAEDLRQFQEKFRISSLAVHPRRLEIKVGEAFSLQKLIITAQGENGKSMGRVPFSLQMEKIEPMVVESQREDARRIKGMRPGEVDLRIVSLIPRSDGTFPTARVRIYVR